MFNTRHLRKFRYEKSVLSASKNISFFRVWDILYFNLLTEISINTKNSHLNKYLFKLARSLDFILE